VLAPPKDISLISVFVAPVRRILHVVHLGEVPSVE
jgi:hypothetical protein